MPTPSAMSRLRFAPRIPAEKVSSLNNAGLSLSPIKEEKRMRSPEACWADEMGQEPVRIGTGLLRRKTGYGQILLNSFAPRNAF